MLILLPLLSLFCNSLIAGVDANLSLGFKVIRLPRHANPANCSVGNTTFAHGATFKLDCKTQCVCENGRHACSSLCPNEQLPAPEDTISCRSPRLVEVPGHCCKMWLCENPTADVYATCHNSSSGNWTSCSRSCGLGIATRHTAIHAGCHQLSNLRLCENRRCAGDNNNNNNNNKNRAHSHELAASQLQQLPQHHHRREPTHRIRKGHECRSQQRLGPARVRLGECVSRKLYRPKLCGRCHHGSMCCTPAVSTTIQVEMLCPLNAVDPINYVQKRTQLKRQQQQQQPAQLWDTLGLEPIDQEFLQSHQIQIENKFIAVEWILKCECSQHYCSADSTDDGKHVYNKHNYNKKHYKKQQKKQQQQQEYYQQAESGKIIDDNKPAISNDDNNSSPEQQPDIIPYPLSVDEIRQQQQQQQQQQQRWQRT